MKKLILTLPLLAAFFITAWADLQPVDNVCEKMEDSHFMEYCYENFDINKDGKVSMAEAVAVHKISVASSGITSLKGIEYFVNLNQLDCSKNKLTSLDISQNPALVKLDCSKNKLSALDVSANIKLTDLNCQENALTNLDISSNTALTNLNCSKNAIISLDVSKNLALTRLNCGNNKISSLDVCSNKELVRLICSKNPLAILYMTRLQQVRTDCAIPSKCVIEYKAPNAE